ncbi:HIT family protein [Adhaeribacter pallidiroseus]|uniref:Putative HIT-like protein n=1 Tax=Adhaeribacter pallidiroseus TaxID=2072847 RepID=A0A369QFD3_9BACT|nr:HIT family protein [Adhaeribacter pallidiroseus]RDC63020.1 putative HIT-like protein [Adhaeribacter pallidiroseus]
MESIFTKIINGSIPAYKVAEDDRFLAFLDISPLQKGHTLVVPKQQIDYIFNLEDTLLADLHLFTKKVALAVEKATGAARIGVAVIGFEVPHAHIHLIPINNLDDMNFANPKLKIAPDEMESLAQKIQNNL